MDNNRRTFISGSLAGFAWLITGGNADAGSPAISAGAPCKVKGRQRTVNGVTFVCRQEKRKLVWRRTPAVVEELVFTARVLDGAALELGKSQVVDVAVPGGGLTGVVLTRTEQGVTALRVNCTHQGVPVMRVGKVLECELHGSRFEPATGEVVLGPAVRPLQRYEVVEKDGGIFVTVRNS
jgi:nitrite reductase/ring-hydroxylating ferredoxin subunit